MAGKSKKEKIEEALVATRLKARPLNTTQDVVVFLSDVITDALSNDTQMNLQRAGIIQKLCETLLKAIRERDSQTPEGQQRELNKAIVASALAKSIPADVALRALKERNLLLVQDYAEGEIINVQEIASVQPKGISGPVGTGLQIKSPQPRPIVEDVF